MKKFNLDEFLIDLKLQLEGSNFESLQSSINDDVQQVPRLNLKSTTMRHCLQCPERKCDLTKNPGLQRVSSYPLKLNISYLKNL